jgi:hypothetical protein
LSTVGAGFIRDSTDLGRNSVTRVSFAAIDAIGPRMIKVSKVINVVSVVDVVRLSAIPRRGKQA